MDPLIQLLITVYVLQKLEVLILDLINLSSTTHTHTHAHTQQTHTSETSYKRTVYQISGIFAATAAVSVLKRKASSLLTAPLIEVVYRKVSSFKVLQ